MVLNVSHYQVKSYSCAVPDATFFVNDLMKYNTVHIHTKIFVISQQTNVSTVLVSVNPNKKLPLYTPDVIDIYRCHCLFDLPPHM